VGAGSPLSLPRITPAQASAVVGGAYAVVVRRDVDHFRRRVLLNLPAAERAARNAREAGKPVEIVLVRLEPVGLVMVDE
jgi:hypothetical protein